MNEQLQIQEIWLGAKLTWATKPFNWFLSCSFITKPYDRVQPVFGCDYPRSGDNEKISRPLN
jgi:hypothetical protein